MHRETIDEGIIRYNFDPYRPHHRFGDSITAISDGERVLLIDAGYAREAETALKDMEAQGLKLEGVIISHFHDDHMQGLKALPRATIYGSARYQETLDMWNEGEDNHLLIPGVNAEKPYAFDFGVHHIELIPSPGHSVCTVLTRIDGKYLHIADEIMFAINGMPLLPSADGRDLARHIRSLEALKQYAGLTFIPAHGPIFGGRERILREIESRTAYLSVILNSVQELTYEEAVKNCGCEFEHREWHRFMYE